MRGSVSTVFLQRFWLKSLISIGLILFSVSCNNIRKIKRSIASTAGASSFVDFEGSGDVGAFRLNTVLPSQQASGTLYDMIGEGQQFDSYCSSTTNPCKCEYTYTQTNVGSQTVLADVAYQEADLIRCVNSVPSGINAFTVRIITADQAYASNTISVTLSGGQFSGSTSYLDLSSSGSFAEVKRYQCRKFEAIKNPLDTSMLDPIQSEDPRIIYPFNYYTTNVGESLLRLQQTNSQTWQCTLTPNKDHTLHWWSNPNVFSLSTCPVTDTFCTGDAELIYPQTSIESSIIPVNNLAMTGMRRASFSLAKRPYGVFQIPVQSAVAPSATNPYTSSTYAVIGYAAKPIPSGTTSSCPDITLPANSRWVKLWNFRATDITSPRYVKSVPASSSNISIACDPGANKGFPSCDYDSVNTAQGVGLNNSASRFGGMIGTTGTYMSRVIVVNGASANACYNVLKTSWVAGAETWQASPYAFQDMSGAPVCDSPAHGCGQIQGFPWNVYQTAYTIPNTGAVAALRYVADTLGAVPVGTPADSQPITDVISQDNYTDNMFVVTNPAVDDTDMKNQASSVSYYHPITYRSAADCNLATRANCPVSQELHWDINTGSVGDASNQFVYPLCAIQFYD